MNSPLVSRTEPARSISRRYIGNSPSRSAPVTGITRGVWGAVMVSVVVSSGGSSVISGAQSACADLDACPESQETIKRVTGAAHWGTADEVRSGCQRSGIVYTVQIPGCVHSKPIRIIDRPCQVVAAISGCANGADRQAQRIFFIILA